MSGHSEATAFLGLGGNLGDPQASMAAALNDLDAYEAIRVVDVSSVYRTPPWGVTDQPDFLNAAAKLATSLPPRDLLDVCLAIERNLKRVRSERWGPRGIDLDILLYGTARIAEEGLSIPHPRMMERAFVLVPLLEIAPGLKVGGASIADALAVLDTEDITRLPSPPDWWRRDSDSG